MRGARRSRGPAGPVQGTVTLRDGRVVKPHEQRRRIEPLGCDERLEADGDGVKVASGWVGERQPDSLPLVANEGDALAAVAKGLVHVNGLVEDYQLMRLPRLLV